MVSDKWPVLACKFDFGEITPQSIATKWMSVSYD